MKSSRLQRPRPGETALGKTLPDVLVLRGDGVDEMFPPLPLGDEVVVERLHALPIPDSLRPAVVILVDPSCASEFFSHALLEVERLCLGYATIVITSRSTGNAYELGRAWRWEHKPPIVWLDDENGSLVRNVRDLLRRDFRRRACEAFLSRVPERCGVLKRVVSTAFLEHPPLRHHSELAVTVQVTQPKIRAQWSAAGLTGRSEALLDWALLAAVLEARPSVPSLAQACLSLRVEPWRVQRASYRRIRSAAGKVDRRRFIQELTAWLGPSSVASAR